MRKLLILLAVLACIPSCTDINYIYMTDGLMIDPYLLTEYNAIVYTHGNPVCGSTIVYSGSDTTCIITAAHCVALFGSHAIEINNGEIYSVKLVDAVFMDSDLALLCTYEEMPIQPYARILLSEPRIAEDIWAVGYGARVKDVITRGIVSKIGTTGHAGRPMNLMDITGWYGNSGGGIFNKHGQLAGVVSQFGPQFDTPREHGPETGWLYGCRVKEIRKLYDRSIGD